MGGDLINLSIGQGDLQVTPLQVAVSFGAAVNGGRVYEPRVVSHFLDAGGEVVDENPLVLVEDLDLDAEAVAFVREDLRQVVNAPYGTAFETFADFGPGLNRVGGKTGTAQIGPRDDDVDTAWFVGVAPTNDPRYIVAVVIDRGGGGSKVAAPVVKSILQYLLQGEAGPVVAGGEGE